MKKFGRAYNIISEPATEIAELSPRRVSQGKTFQNNEECCAAAHAIDKDLSTVAATHTDSGAGWLKLEFDKTYFIHKIVIYYRFYTDWYHPINWCLQSEARHKECVDNDNNVDVSVYQGEVKQKSCGTLQLTYGLEQSDQIYTLICNAAGNTVILSKSVGVMSLYEVIVTGLYSAGNLRFTNSSRQPGLRHQNTYRGRSIALEAHHPQSQK